MRAHLSASSAQHRPYHRRFHCGWDPCYARRQNLREAGRGWGSRRQDLAREERRHLRRGHRLYCVTCVLCQAVLLRVHSQRRAASRTRTPRHVVPPRRQVRHLPRHRMDGARAPYCSHGGLPGRVYFRMGRRTQSLVHLHVRHPARTLTTVPYRSWSRAASLRRRRGESHPHHLRVGRARRSRPVSMPDRTHLSTTSSSGC